MTLLALLACLLQDPEPKVSLRAATTPEGVVLRWVVLGKAYPEGGFHLYRRRAGGAWERATAEPVRRWTPAEIERAFGKPFADVMHGYLGPAPRDKREAQEFALAVRCDIDLRAAKAAGFYYLDSGAARGARYDYELRALAGGREERWASFEGVEAGGEVRLGVPEGLKASLGPDGVGLTWNRVPGIHAYVVYRADAQEGKLERLTDPAAFLSMDAPDAREPSPAHFVDENGPVGKTVWYAVAALDLFGREGAASARLKVQVRDTTPPPPPKGLKAETRDGAVRLDWEAVTSSDLVGYHVYRASGEEAERITREPVRDPRFEDRPPSPGAYVYFARAVDSSGNESAAGASAVVRIEDREPPARVGGLRAAPEKGCVSLEWAAVPDKDLSHYAVFRASGAEGPWMRIGETRERAFADQFAESIGGSMWYRVRAIDRSGNEGAASEAVEARLPDTVPPAAPSLIRAVPVETGTRLEWTLLDERDVAGVRVEWAEAEGGPWRDVSGLIEGKSYASDKRGWFRLVAEDAAKNRSEPSNVLSVPAIDRTPPARPKGLAARPFEEGVRLTWRANVEDDLEGYFVERLEEGAWRQVGDAVERPEAVDWTARSGVSCRYRVVAYDRSGNRSEPSEEVEAKR
jgi:fibronectin type 3 domain-containing protein